MLARILVKCPQCRYRALLDHGDAHHLLEIGSHCKNGKTASDCPALAPALARARETLDRVEE
jgi:hypothetical protein